MSIHSDRDWGHCDARDGTYLQLGSESAAQSMSLSKSGSQSFSAPSP